MRILVASDLSARSDRAVARGFVLARELQATLRILHVVDADLPEDLQAHAMAWGRDALSRTVQRLTAQTGVQASLEIRAGHPKTDVTAQTHPDKTDLVIVGIHNRAASQSGALGETTAGAVLRSSVAPMLLVRDAASAPYRRVAIAVDFSLFSRTAIIQARRVAPAATLALVHAYHVPFRGLFGGASFPQEVARAEQERLETFLRDEIEALGDRASAAGISADSLATTIREGEPAAVLRSECGRLNADLLVIGTHSRTGVSRAVWGSVAAALLDDPPCDVLVVRPY